MNKKLIQQSVKWQEIYRSLKLKIKTACNNHKSIFNKKTKLKCNNHNLFNTRNLNQWAFVIFAMKIWLRVKQKST